MALISERWRRRLLLPMLVASVGVPVAWFNDGVQNTAKSAWEWTKSAPNKATAKATPSAEELLSDNRPGAKLQHTVTGAPADPLALPEAGLPTPTLSGPRVNDFREVMRFDVNPGWVSSKWSRVSASLADTKLEGMRVPLVTGTRFDDISGSLTYYFDKEHHLQRLSFEGYTGDPRRLVKLATSYFKLNGHPTLGAGLYTAQWHGRPTSVLWIHHAPVVKANTPRSKYKIVMEINRPRNGIGLSDKTEKFVMNEMNAGRW